jgi:predicted DsbA family dithiol-disulfide isomerase
MTTEAQTSSTALPVVVFADFVCPYSYIAQEQVDQLIREYDVQVLWKPCWLHPEVPPEGKTMSIAPDSDRRQATMAWLKEMAPDMATRMRFPGKMQFSFFAFEAMEFAEDRGRALPFKTAVFDALWVEGKDIAQAATLQEAAEKAGLDAEDLGRALRDRTYRQRTAETVVTARNLGITLTPTMILGRTKITGWHYYEVMQTVLQKQGILPKTAQRADGSSQPQP